MAKVLPGATPTEGSSSPWGMVPQVPDPISTGNLAITGDIGNLPSLTDLASQVNRFNTGAAIQPYIENLPGYQGMVAQSSQNIGNLLQGNIPPDVLRLIQQQAAERGVNTGLAGSPNSMASYLQALGLTSLGLQQQGEGELTQAIGRTPVPQLFNVAQFLTTPGEEQAAQMAANIYAAAPDPNRQAQALMSLFSEFMNRFQGTGYGGPSAGPSFPPWPNIPAAQYPPASVSGGGGPLQVGPPAGGGGGGTPMNLTGQAQPGFTSTGTGAGTFPGFGTGPTGSGPAQQDWSGFLNALNPQSTAANTWFGMNPQDLSFMNSFQSPGFGPGGGPSPGDWEGFLGALNPGTPAGTGYDPFTDSSVNMPWLSPDQTPTGTVYDPFTDSSVNMGSTDTITPSWSDFEQSYFNQFLEGP